MTGVVLSGGQSTRMGRDKGLMTFDGKTWSEIVRERLNTTSIKTFISINAQQLDEYSKRFKRSDLIVDNQDLKIQGPMTGLISAHLLYPEEDIVVTACDMIQMQSVVIDHLMEEFKRGQPEAIAFKGERVEPLCAIYSSNGLKKIRAAYEAQALESHGMKYALEMLDAIYLPISNEWLPFFRNFNQAEDLF